MRFGIKILVILLSGLGISIWLAGCVVTPEPIPLFDGSISGDLLPPFGYDGGNEGKDGVIAPPDLDYVPGDAATSVPDAGPPDVGWAPDGAGDGQPDGLLEDGGPHDGGPGEGGPLEDGPLDDSGTGPANDLTGDVVPRE
jgi:hypothetical protein